MQIRRWIAEKVLRVPVKITYLNVSGPQKVTLNGMDVPGADVSMTWDVTGSELSKEEWLEGNLLTPTDEEAG